MAMGLGRMLGFTFPQNFDHPYLARSVSEFWRRWHMSLTSWFREYVYIPLGGNRGGLGKTLRNILIVWLLTGIWHGAGWNFLLWGLYFACWLMLEKLVPAMQNLPRPLAHVYTLFVAVVGWGLFALEDMGECGRYLKVCFGGGPLWSPADGYALRSYLPLLLILAVASTMLGRQAWSCLSERTRRIVSPILMLSAFFLCTAYLVDGSYNPFLYFRF